MPELKQLLTDISAAIIDYPEQLVIDEREEGDTIVFTVTVAESDMGKIIGRRGKNAKCLRTVMKAAGNTVGKKIIVDIAMCILQHFTHLRVDIRLIHRTGINCQCIC